MIKVFNAFQLVSFFAAAPFGISWLSEQTFRGSGIAFWVSVIIYVIMFILNIVSVTIAMDENKW